MPAAIIGFIAAVHRAADSVTADISCPAATASIGARAGIHAEESVIAGCAIDTIARTTRLICLTEWFRAFIACFRTIIVTLARAIRSVMHTTIGTLVAAIGGTTDEVAARISGNTHTITKSTFRLGRTKQSIVTGDSSRRIACIAGVIARAISFDTFIAGRRTIAILHTFATRTVMLTKIRALIAAIRRATDIVATVFRRTTTAASIRTNT